MGWGAFEVFLKVCVSVCMYDDSIVSEQECCSIYAACPVPWCEIRLVPTMMVCASVPFDLSFRFSRNNFVNFSVFFTGKYLNICGVGST